MTASFRRRECVCVCVQQGHSRQLQMPRCQLSLPEAGPGSDGLIDPNWGNAALVDCSCTKELGGLPRMRVGMCQAQKGVGLSGKWSGSWGELVIEKRQIIQVVNLWGACANLNIPVGHCATGRKTSFQVNTPKS